MTQPSHTPLTPDHPFIARVVRALHQTYGANLVSVALFGSVARRTARPNSDLDLFLVVEGLPNGRRARLGTFDAVEQLLAADVEVLRRAGINAELSAILRTPADLQTATPLMFDLTEDAIILEDRGGVLAAALEDLRRRLRRLGSRRVWRGATWYWDLKPDYRRGEIIRL